MRKLLTAGLVFSVGYFVSGSMGVARYLPPGTAWVLSWALSLGWILGALGLWIAWFKRWPPFARGAEVPRAPLGGAAALVVYVFSLVVGVGAWKVGVILCDVLASERLPISFDAGM